MKSTDTLLEGAWRIRSDDPWEKGGFWLYTQGRETGRANKEMLGELYFLIICRHLVYPNIHRSYVCHVHFSHSQSFTPSLTKAYAKRVEVLTFEILGTAWALNISLSAPNHAFAASQTTQVRLSIFAHTSPARTSTMAGEQQETPDVAVPSVM